MVVSQGAASQAKIAAANSRDRWGDEFHGVSCGLGI